MEANCKKASGGNMKTQNYNGRCDSHEVVICAGGATNLGGGVGRSGSGAGGT